MTVIDPGHRYKLNMLDVGKDRIFSDTSWHADLIFVKRCGPGYPGNNSSYPGTTLQEVIRSCLDRVWYLQSQIWNWRNCFIIGCLILCLWLLEWRASQRHNRRRPSMKQAAYGKQCSKCLHVGCAGRCHKEEA